MKLCSVRPRDSLTTCTVMSGLGQLRTLATYRCHVCFQGYSGRNRHDNGHRLVNVGSWGRCRRTGDMAEESVVSQKATLADPKG